MGFVVIRSLFFCSRPFLKNIFAQMSHTKEPSALLLVQPQNKTAPLALITSDHTQRFNFKDVFGPNPANDLKRMLIFGHGCQITPTVKDQSDYPVSMFGEQGYRTAEVAGPVAAYPGLFGTEPKKKDHDYSLRPFESGLATRDPVVSGLLKFFPPQTSSAIIRIINAANNSQRNADMFSVLSEIKPADTLADFSNDFSIDHTTLCTQILMMIIAHRFTKGRVIAKQISQDGPPLESFLRYNPHAREFLGHNPELLTLIQKSTPVKYNLVIPVTNYVSVNGILNILKETYNPREQGVEVVGLFCRHREGDRTVKTDVDGFPIQAHYAGLPDSRLHSRNPWATKRALTYLPSKNVIDALRIAQPDRDLTAEENALIASAVLDWANRDLGVFVQNFPQEVAQYVQWFQEYSMAYINMTMNNMHMTHVNRVV